MTTQELMDIAVKRAGLTKTPPDSIIMVEGDNIHRILAGIDMGSAEVAVAAWKGYDCVARHHPQDVVMVTLGTMERDAHVEHMVQFGVDREKALEIWGGQPEKTFQKLSVINYGMVSSMARLLNMPSLNVHFPADRIVQGDLQARFDKLSQENPHLTVGDILDSMMEIREYSATPQGPSIWIGTKSAPAGKVMVSMAGGCSPCLEEYLACIDAGVNTFVVMHMPMETKQALVEDGRCNAVIAGHMASDSYGFNRILDAWEEHGMIVDRYGGIVY